MYFFINSNILLLMNFIDEIAMLDKSDRNQISISQEKNCLDHNEYETLLEYGYKLLENATSLFNNSIDFDIIDIAIFKQILAEKLIEYAIKKIKDQN